MLAIVLGFVLLVVMVLGAAICALALVFLAAALGVQIFAAALGAVGAPILSFFGALQLAAAACFVMGLVFVGVGSLSLLFPFVRLFLNGLLMLFRLATNNPLLAATPGLFRTAANGLDLARNLLVGPVATGLQQAGQTLRNAAAALPSIPTIQPQQESLWLRFDNAGNRTEGYLPQPPLIPNVSIVTGLAIGQAPINPVTAALNNSGTFVGNLGQDASAAAGAMAQTATALRDIAGAIEQAMQ